MQWCWCHHVWLLSQPSVNRINSHRGHTAYFSTASYTRENMRSAKLSQPGKRLPCTQKKSKKLNAQRLQKMAYCLNEVVNYSPTPAIRTPFGHGEHMKSIQRCGNALAVNRSAQSKPLWGGGCTPWLVMSTMQKWEADAQLGAVEAAVGVEHRLFESMQHVSPFANFWNDTRKHVNGGMSTIQTGSAEASVRWLNCLTRRPFCHLLEFY